MKPLLILEGRMRFGALTVVLPNGRSIRVTGRSPGRTGEIRLNRWRAVRRVLAAGGIGFGEGYMDGDWDSPDLPALIETLAANLPKNKGLVRRLSPLRLANRLRHLCRPNSRNGAARNIAAHYDLGNDFYALWLDPTMTYSAAVFSGGAIDLESAQREKYRRLLDLIDPRPGDRILEVGCGWGGFAIQAAQERDVYVTAITISRAQFEEAQRRVAAAGVGDRVDVQLRDYRDLDGTYDHAVSIEMIEAVGEHYWRDYFARVAASIRSGGRFALQAIVINDERFEGYRRSADFIQKHVFPGGLLPSPKAMRREAAAAGFDWHSHDTYGIDYAETLARWRDGFDAAAERVHDMGFDERFRRCWTFYLAYCEGGFRAGNIDALQVAFTRR
ncbi:MAG: cyclopropane-fatty-acyl-phospholipid synthase family protein [Alphaproteobacteria bacterium]|jgi:cyclopropane-fatty-acyl-phospholipid synthase